MTEYYVFEIENTKYKLMLDKLCNLSDRFCLVEPIADTKDFPDILPEFHPDKISMVLPEHPYEGSSSCIRILPLQFQPDPLPEWFLSHKNLEILHKNPDSFHKLL